MTRMLESKVEQHLRGSDLRNGVYVFRLLVSPDSVSTEFWESRTKEPRDSFSFWTLDEALETQTPLWRG